jgi:NADH-quinone oxidoreductase subunit L
VKWSPFAVMALGLLTAWYAYMRNPRFPATFVAQFGVLYRFVYNKWYFDELYNVLFVRPAFWIGRQFWKIGDIGIIDRFGRTARPGSWRRVRPTPGKCSPAIFTAMRW